MMPWDGFAWQDWAVVLCLVLAFGFSRLAWLERPRG